MVVVHEKLAHATRFTLSTAALLGIVSTASAMHPYSDEDCKVKLPNGTNVLLVRGKSYTGAGKIVIGDANDPSGGIDAPMTYLNFPDGEKPATTPDKDDLLDVVAATARNVVSKKYDDGCFQGEQRTFTRLITIKAIRPSLAAMLKWRVGQKLLEHCESESIAPVGPSCENND